MKKNNQTKQTIHELSLQRYQTDNSGIVSTGCNSSLDKGRSGGISFLPPYGGGTFCEAKGGGVGVGELRSKKAFTLVELIIVITILAILATIAFMSFQGYTSKSRDSNRVASVKNAEIGMEVFQAKSGVYPIQSTGAEISVGTGNVITRQGDFDLSIARVINLNEVPRDPKTGAMYNYISDTEGKGYKVLYYLENTSEYALIGQTYADDAEIPVVKGQGPGVLLDSADGMVSEDIDLFGADSGSTFTVIVSEGIEMTGTGLELGGGFENFAKKGGNLDAPKTCPEGFIPVPGNAEFLQPGFCVMKYEASYEDESLIPLDHNRNTIGSGSVHPSCTIQNPTTNYTSGEDCIPSDFEGHQGGIVSKTGRYPIAYLTQHEAIQACKSIGAGQHLITNHEWMTIARNIEANGVNWSGGIVGNGFIFNGLSRGIYGCGNVTTSTLYPSQNIGYRGAKVGSGGNLFCDTIRQQTLSNGSIIWDFAGNFGEYVNKANTVDGKNYNVGYLKIDNNGANWNIGGTSPRQSYTYHKYGWSTITDDIRKRYGPSKSTYSLQNGMGNLYGWFISQGDHNVLTRGGDAGGAGNAGIYTIGMLLGKFSHYENSVFRCAY